MPRFTRSQFAELIKKTASYINVYVGRNAIILSHDEKGFEFIDSDLELNKYFLQKRGVSLDGSELPEVIKPKKTVESEIEQAQQPLEKVKTKHARSEGESTGYVDLDKQKKKLEIEKLQKDVHLKEIELKKKQGEVIPVDVINGLISRLGKNYVTSFKNEADKYLTHVVNRTGADRETANKLKGDLIESINNAIKETLDITSKELEAIVKDYTVSRK
jgi:hypothetical protein